MIRALTRRWLGLPSPRYRSVLQREWISLSDGVRLATTLLHPVDLPTPRAPAVLIRTPFGLRSPLEPTALLASALAGTGLHVLVQDVRGRFASEGRFVPFSHEARDGEETLDWIREQPWCDGRLGMLGFSYAAWSALATASRDPEGLAALVVAGAGANLQQALRPGGAFALELALRLAAGLAGREPQRLDLERALCHRPIREADRVGVRELPWFREWLSHPVQDGYWQALRPPVARQPPSSLFLCGFHDPFLASLLEERAAFAAARPGGAELVLGPWPHPRPPRLTREGRAHQRIAFREVLDFLAVKLGNETAEKIRPVRVYAGPAEGVLGLDSWPPPRARRHLLYLRSGGSARTAAGDGRLEPEAPGVGEPPDRFVYDPSDPVPSLGGALLLGFGNVDQRPIEGREDLLCYTGEPLAQGLQAVGPVHVVLHAASSAPDTDFTATLVDVAPTGRSSLLCQGIVRCRHRQGGPEPTWLEPDQAVRLEIDCGAIAHAFGAGHRIRLEVSSSSFPRFDRNPNTQVEPADATEETSETARQTVLHEASHPSYVELFAMEG